MPFIRKGVMTKNAMQKYGGFIPPIIAFIIGMTYEHYRVDSYRSFHNKSKLYGGRDLKPGETIW